MATSAADFEWFHDAEDDHPMGSTPPQPEPGPSQPPQNPSTLTPAPGTRIRQLRGQAKIALHPTTGTLDEHVPVEKIAGVWQNKRVRAGTEDNPSPLKKNKVKGKQKKKKPTIRSESDDVENSTDNTDDGNSSADSDLQKLETLSAQDKLVC